MKLAVFPAAAWSISKSTARPAHEPYEQVTVDADARRAGDIMSALGSRGAELKDMQRRRSPAVSGPGLHGARRAGLIAHFKTASFAP